ncbi:MAG: signal peptidase II [Kineosporiaceae bacterium]
MVVDQVTKRWALTTLQDGPIVAIDGYLRFRLTFNTGAAFSTGQTMTEALSVLSATVSVILLVAIARAWSLRWGVALGLLLGGAVGNLVDRLTRPPGFGEGAVVDFLELLRFPGMDFPVFNLADVGITTAALSIVLLTFSRVPYREGEDAGNRRVGR